MGYRHTVRVRYGECDMQRVVFNAHYLAYCDDAVDTWFRSVLGQFDADPDGDAPFDFMVKRVAIEWASPARFGDVMELDCAVSRWGTSSFDVTVTGAAAGERPVFTATLVYVSVGPGSSTPVAVPDAVRVALAS